MRTKLCVSVVVVCLAVLFSTDVNAQSDPEPEEIKRFELGGQFTYLGRKDPEVLERAFVATGAPNAENGGTIHEAGFGARLTFNLNRNIAIEAEANFFPEDKQLNLVVGQIINVFEPGGRKFQMLFGPKIGMRKKKFGVFAKARPGFVTLGRHEVVIQLGIGGPLVLTDVRNNVSFFAIDLGGVFEFYPTKRTVFRVDVGDTIINYRSLEPTALNPSITKHNLQTSVGFGFRF